MNEKSIIEKQEIEDLIKKFNALQTPSKQIKLANAFNAFNKIIQNQKELDNLNLKKKERKIERRISKIWEKNFPRKKKKLYQRNLRNIQKSIKFKQLNMQSCMG